MACSDILFARSTGAYMGSNALNDLKDDLDSIVLLDPLYTKSGDNYYYDGSLLSLMTSYLSYDSSSDSYNDPVAFIDLPFTKGSEKDVYGYRGNSCTFTYYLGDGTLKSIDIDIATALGDYADDDGCFWMPVSKSYVSQLVLRDQLEYYEDLNSCCLDDCW